MKVTREDVEAEVLKMVQSISYAAPEIRGMHEQRLIDKLWVLISRLQEKKED